MDKLEKELMDIESKLGGSGSASANVEDKLQWHLDYIESLAGIDTLVLPITYSELKAKRDAGELVPGMKYRIIDYVATVNSYNDNSHKSAFNKFDIVVTATSNNTLSEDAKAMISDDDNSHFATKKHELVSASWNGTPTFEELKESFLYKGNTGNEETSYKEDTNDAACIITEIGTRLNKNGVMAPAMLNPDPEAAVSKVREPSGNDCWYVFTGRVTIDGEECDVWQEWKSSSGWGTGDEYFHYTRTGFVNAEFIEKRIINSNLNAWEIKYCLDNDGNRFNWASNCNGNTAIRVLGVEDGVYYIYKRYPEGDTEDKICWTYVINSDDFLLNDNTLDWDNINTGDVIMTNKVVNIGDKFDVEGYLYQIIDVSGRGVIYYLKDEWGNEAGFDFKGILIYGQAYNRFDFYYLFSSSITYPEKKDISLLGCCVNNKIGIPDEWDWNEGVSYMIHIPSTICAGPNDDTCCCQENIVGKNCYNILLDFQGSNTSRNIIGNYCSDITLMSCQDNVIGIDCSSIKIYQNSIRNTVGRNCYQITLSSGCLYNIIEDDVRNNIWFGTNCKYNKIGSKCSNIVLGNYNENNTFGTSCSFIQLGNKCYDWIFDNDCTTITFESTANYVKGFKFEGVCSNFLITITGNATASNYAQDKVFHSVRCEAGSSYSVTVDRANKYQIDYYWENNNFIEVASHKVSKIYKHNIRLELEGSGGDKSLYLTLFNHSNEKITINEILDYIAKEWLKNTLVFFSDDVSAKYNSFIVEEYYNFESQGAWHGYIISGHSSGSNQQYEVIIDDQNGTTVMNDYIQEL